MTLEVAAAPLDDAVAQFTLSNNEVGELYHLKELQMKTQQANPNILGVNQVLDADSYKLTHVPKIYPPDVAGMHAYIEARELNNRVIVPFGLQMWVKKNLLTPVTKADVDEAEAYAAAHFPPNVRFNRADWLYLLDKYGGFFPVTIRAVPEGLRVPSSNAIVTVESLDKRLFWLAMYVETSLQRGIWYPTTIASNDFQNWKTLKFFYDKSAETNDLLPFALHDFGGRGVTAEEQAQIGGAAHLVYFTGSDTVSGVRAANFYYGTQAGMSAFSVAATEHSVQCAWGPERQKEYLQAVLNEYAKPGAIVSIVIDGYDTYREAGLLCREFKDQIIKSGAKIVFRPDSGIPKVVINKLLEMQADAFGFEVNSKLYKKVNHVGIIYGDGIKPPQSLREILNDVTDQGWAADNVIFGSGGGLLQDVDRDTYKFAQKASAYLSDEQKWVEMFKDPVTDHGKRSKGGRHTLLRSKLDGGYLTATHGVPHDSEWDDVMEVVYDQGELVKTYTLDEIRARATA